MNLLLGLLGDWGPALAALGVSTMAYLTGRRSGRQGAENKALRETQKRQKDARNAVADEQAEIDGLSSRDIADRLRRRGDDWRGV